MTHASPKADRMNPASPGLEHAVPRINFAAFTPDILDHLETPLVVEGWPTPPRELSPERLQAELGAQMLWVYDRNLGDSWQEYTAAEFVAQWTSAHPNPGLNVVDVYLQDPRFDVIFPVPPAFDGNNVLLQDARTAHYRRSVVLTAPGAYTPMHVDSYGAGGWMYLIEGEKHWELAHADTAAGLWDEAALDYADPKAGTWPEAVPTWTATLRAGELMVCPPGFVHRVATPVRCTGFGGAYIPRGQVARALDVWAAEKAHGVAGDLDLAELMHTALVATATP